MRVLLLRNIFALFVLLLCGCACSVLGNDEEHDEEHYEEEYFEEEVEDPVPVPTNGSLDEMIDYLRHDDTRLIRYNVGSPIAWHRQDLLCSSHLEGFLERLSTSSTPVEEQVKLAKLVTLCSSENPERRSFIANFKLGDALKSIVNLLDQNEDSITAVVGDAVWILSFADPHSHKYFVEHAVDKMAARLVERTKALPDLSDAEKPAAALAVMWMAAGLQNLAASYCDTESGHCWWEYQFPEDETTPDSEYGVYLHQESPLEVDGKLAASKMAANDELVTTLQTLVCQDPMTVDDEEFWASEATLEKAASGTVDPKIITWAVTGLIKNLSMYEESYKITVAAKDCLCKLVLSEDWLEMSKAEDAMHRTGFTEADCPGYYDHEEL